jgi:hypothetical protein
VRVEGGLGPGCRRVLFRDGNSRRFGKGNHHFSENAHDLDDVGDGRLLDDDESGQVVPMDPPIYPVSDSEIAADIRVIETTMLGLYIALGWFASDFYNRVEPARLRWLKKQLCKGDPDIPSSNIQRSGTFL